MRIASIKPDDLAVVRNGQLIPVGDLLARQGLLPSGKPLEDLGRGHQLQEGKRRTG